MSERPVNKGGNRLADQVTKATRGRNDWVLIGTTLGLTIFGLLMVYSSSYVEGFLLEPENPTYYLTRQLIWFALAIPILVFMMYFRYEHYQKMTPVLLGVSIVLLLLVVLIGTGRETTGADRWIRMGSLNMQPSEFVKVAMAIYLAHVYSRKQAYIAHFKTGVLPPLVVVGVIFSLIMLQPDFGTGTLIMLTAIMLVFFSGAKWRHLFGLAAVGIVGFLVLALLRPYRIARLTSFLDPFADATNSGFQLINGYLAIANGGVTGMGIGQSLQKMRHLPEAHTDFILAVISEELGFLGVLIVLIGYGIILFRGVAIGTKCKNPFGSLLAFAIVFQMAAQVVFNVGAVTGLLPITGMTLPLISYGGTSLLVTFISIGILASIHRHNGRQVL